MKAFAPHPITPQCLSMVPPDSFFFMGMTFDPVLLVDETVKFVHNALPEYSGHLEAAFHELKRESGFDLRKEVLAPLGSEISLFVLPQKSGLIPEFFLTMGLRDAEGFQSLLERVIAMAPDEVKLLETSYQGRTMRYLSTSEIPIPISPTFIVEEGRLIVSSTTLGMKKYLRWLAEGGPGLAETDEFRKAMADVPEGISGLQYMNMPKLIGMLYETGAPFLPMVLSQTELPLDMALLPMADTLTDCFSCAVSYCQVDSDGYLLAGRSSFGTGALLTTAVSLADYMVEKDLLTGLVGTLTKTRKIDRKRALDNTADALFQSCYACMTSGQYKEALNRFTAWIERFPDNENYPMALMHRGYCNLKLRRYEDGIADYKTVVEKTDFRQSTALYNICCGYSCLDQGEMALKYLKKAIAAGFDDMDLLESDPDLNSIRNTEEFGALMELLK